MADIFEDAEREQRSQKIKSNEITGERYAFHSLPKELQDMSNVYYIQEKEGQGSIDKNAISKANLNGYMWMCIADGTSYGLYATIVAVSGIIKWKLSGGFLGFLLSAIIYIPILFFIAYHFIYYAIIRSQVVGPITQSVANFTSYTFYMTFFSVFLAMMTVFVFVASMIKDILLLLFQTIASLSSTVLPGSYQSKFVDMLIWLHNKLAEIFISSDYTWNNIYFLTFITVAFSCWFIYMFESKAYKPNKIDIEQEYTNTGLRLGYPIEAAQKLFKGWREKNEKAISKISGSAVSFLQKTLSTREGGKEEMDVAKEVYR